MLYCTKCSTSLPLWVIKARDSAMCPSCNSDLLIRVFPALLTPHLAIDPQTLSVEEGEASCFFHSSKRAADTCQNCGRFICSLCRVEFDGGIWCSPCLASASANRKHGKLETRRVLFDSIALGLATIPALLFFYPVLLTGPCALFVSIFYWKRPTSIARPNKWRFVVAILLSSFEIVILLVLIFAVIFAASRQRAGIR